MYIVFVPGRVRESNSTRWQMAWSLRCSKKTREVWVGEGKDEWNLGQVVYASFLSLRCYYPAVCLFPSILLTKHLEQGKREPLHPSEAFLWKLDRQLMHDETGGIYLHHYIPKSWREHNVPNKLLSLLQISPIRYFGKWKSIMPTSHLF